LKKSLLGPMARKAQSLRILSEAKAIAPLSDAMSRGAEAIEQFLDSVLTPPEGPEARLFNSMRYSSLGGGKRMRPFLTMQSARLFGVPDSRALRAGAAVELVHCYSLIHDDLPAMDDDDFRRGKPSNHKAYDDATAILAGDALLTLAFEVLAHSDTHPEGDVRSELVLGLTRAAGANGMVGGQMIDLLAEDMDADVSLISRIQRLKTGALIAFACEAGAILGKANDEQKEALRRYSNDVGLAFQIKDDLLDTLGKAEDIGKATQKDADAGKATFVGLLGVEEAQQRAELLCQQAISHLEIFGDNAAHLRGIARFAIDRRT